MLKIFLMDMKLLKKPFLLLVLSIPLLHYIDSQLFYVALPTSVDAVIENTNVRVNESFAAYSGWPFAIISSIVLLLFSVESGSSSQGRLPTLLSLPLSRFQIAILRHLPALVLIPLLGLILNLYRVILTFFSAMSRTDLWTQTQTMDFETARLCLVWAFNTITNIQGIGHASLAFQVLGWAAMSLLILGIPLLIDDLWPQIKRSSLALWLSVSLFLGLALQAIIFALGKTLGLHLLPHLDWPAGLVAKTPAWQPNLLVIELCLAGLVLGLELWRFQRRTTYV